MHKEKYLCTSKLWKLRVRSASLHRDHIIMARERAHKGRQETGEIGDNLWAFHQAPLLKINTLVTRLPTHRQALRGSPSHF